MSHILRVGHAKIVLSVQDFAHISFEHIGTEPMPLKKWYYALICVRRACSRERVIFWGAF